MFSKACKYGIRATLYLAVHASEEKKMSIDELSSALGTPRHFLAKILQQMTKHHIVSSAKGPNGGFYLSEENRKAPLEKVIMCIDGPDFFNGCIIGLHQCSSAHPCPLHAQAYAYRQGLHYQLKYQSIGELAEKTERGNLNL